MGRFITGVDDFADEAMSYPAQIESIEIKKYRVFREVVFSDLPRMTVVIGANGTGKSTFFDVFAFLKDALAETVAVAVARRGGFRELVSRDTEGPIELNIRFRESGGRLASYQLQIADADGRAVVGREVLSYRRGRHGWPWRFVDFQHGAGKAITNESEYGQDGVSEKWEYHELNDPSTLAIKGLGQFRDFPVVSELRSMIEGWHISDFHIADARPSAEAGYAEHLSPRGDNLAQVAKYLYENHPGRFDQILQAMRRRVPGLSSVEAKSTEDGRLVLRFEDGSFKDPFIARNVSDGAIKIFAYLVLLYDPKPQPMLVVEEPENYLYYEFLQELAEEFRAYANLGGQVFVSTHSPEFLNGVELKEIFGLVKRNGSSTVERAYKSETLRSMFESGDFLLGPLFRQGILVGAGLQ